MKKETLYFYFLEEPHSNSINKGLHIRTETRVVDEQERDTYLFNHILAGNVVILKEDNIDKAIDVYLENYENIIQAKNKSIVVYKDRIQQWESDISNITEIISSIEELRNTLIQEDEYDKEV